MLMANETVAEECCREDMPFVYRTHENPDPEKVESLLTLLHNQGVSIQKTGQEITPKEIQTILESIEGLPNEPQISRLTLRTMNRQNILPSAADILALQQSITAISPLPSAVIRICRSTGSSRTGFAEDWKEKERRSIIRKSWRMLHVSPAYVNAGQDEAERESDKLKKSRIYVLSYRRRI